MSEGIRSLIEALRARGWVDDPAPRAEPAPGRLAAQGHDTYLKAEQIADRIAERVLATARDPWLSLKKLAAYSSLSVRTLRAFLSDVDNPLPAKRPGGGTGKVLVKQSAFDGWMEQWNSAGGQLYEKIAAARAARRPRETKAIEPPGSCLTS